MHVLIGRLKCLLGSHAWPWDSVCDLLRGYTTCVYRCERCRIVMGSHGQ